MSGPAHRGILDVGEPRRSKNVKWNWGSWPPAGNVVRRLEATPQELGSCRAYPGAGREVRCRCGAGPWDSITDYERHERGLPPLVPVTPVGRIDWPVIWPPPPRARDAVVITGV